MNNFLIAILIGLLAGLIDIIPMIIQKLDKRDTISAFIHYFALGLIIPFVNLGIAPWITGIGIALLTSIPIMIIVYPRDKKAIIPMIVFSLILGAGIGIAGAKFVG
ncbi:hypothetical protein EO244_16660 [Ancylomarina salipaludis]|uniref:Uncharacterized protein n=1 Tax=Ancylomarina salipaludis TaxID=2501299 RepID=A0A4Q1JHI7_9BACT|nr:hypothetical protein [Ancylomarina salipaludis]RXQ87173.1 hypothetical protein EO244_16660 [Ancylomarina salipaludis]